MVGVLSAAKISSAYSIDLVGNDIIILLRHRALLFGIVGGFVLFSVYKPAYQSVAMVMAAISMVGFLYFVWAMDDYNDSITRIAMIDLAGIACLVLATVLKYVSAKKQ